MIVKSIKIGTVSHGTLRPEDLAPAFVEAAQNLGIDLPEELVEAASDIYADMYDGDASEVIEGLIDAINADLPTFLRFGAHEGDGSDFGVWPIDGLEDGFVEALLAADALADGTGGDAQIDALQYALAVAIELLCLRA